MVLNHKILIVVEDEVDLIFMFNISCLGLSKPVNKVSILLLFHSPLTYVNHDVGSSNPCIPPYVHASI